jgi:hypothetical protein
MICECFACIFQLNFRKFLFLLSCLKPDERTIDFESESAVIIYVVHRELPDMAAKFGEGRFSWGIDIDNMWRYTGTLQPKSIIIPYLLSIRLPRGPLRVHPEEDKVKDALRGPAGPSGQDSVHQSKELATDLKSAGIQFVRTWFQWNFFEERYDPNQSDFKFPCDEFVSDMNDAGIEIVAVVGNGYSRFLPQGINTDDPEGYVRALTRSTSEIVRHYKDSIGVWQIENEPNWWLEHTASHWRSGGIWFEKGIQDRILSTLHSIVREEAPNSKIVVNLECDEKKIDFKASSKYCDILGLDFYPNYIRSSPVDASKVKFAAEVGKQLDMPLYIAETGYPSGPILLGYDNSKQAAYIRSACENSFATDEITGLGVWRYIDSYWRSFPDQENHFGLISKEGSPKPAWNEYVNQIRSKTH